MEFCSYGSRPPNQRDRQVGRHRPNRRLTLSVRGLDHPSDFPGSEMVRQPATTERRSSAVADRRKARARSLTRKASRQASVGCSQAPRPGADRSTRGPAAPSGQASRTISVAGPMARQATQVRSGPTPMGAVPGRTPTSLPPRSRWPPRSTRQPRRPGRPRRASRPAHQSPCRPPTRPRPTRRRRTPLPGPPGSRS